MMGLLMGCLFDDSGGIGGVIDDGPLDDGGLEGSVGGLGSEPMFDG